MWEKTYTMFEHKIANDIFVEFFLQGGVSTSASSTDEASHLRLCATWYTLTRIFFAVDFHANFLSGISGKSAISPDVPPISALSIKGEDIFALSLPTCQLGNALCSSSLATFDLSVAHKEVFRPWTHFSIARDLERCKCVLSATPTTTTSPTPMPPTTRTTRRRTTRGGTWCQATTRSWWEMVRVTRRKATTTPTTWEGWDWYLSNSLSQLATWPTCPKFQKHSPLEQRVKDLVFVIFKTKMQHFQIFEANITLFVGKLQPNSKTGFLKWDLIIFKG